MDDESKEIYNRSETDKTKSIVGVPDLLSSTFIKTFNGQQFKVLPCNYVLRHYLTSQVVKAIGKRIDSSLFAADCLGGEEQQSMDFEKQIEDKQIDDFYQLKKQNQLVLKSHFQKAVDVIGNCDSKAVGSSAPLIEKKDYLIQKESFLRLTQGRWLNDEVVNAYVILLNN